ncbi:hypothetical protein JOM56_012496 [Amanita muscaria]
MSSGGKLAIGTRIHLVLALFRDSWALVPFPRQSVYIKAGMDESESFHEIGDPYASFSGRLNCSILITSLPLQLHHCCQRV